MTQNNDQPKTMVSGLFTGYLILIMHLLLIVVVAMAVVFLKSLYDIRWLLLAGGLLLIAASAWFFYQRFKKSKHSLQEVMNNPTLQGRSVEISLLGGLASVKLGNHNTEPTTPILIDANGNNINPLTLPAPNHQSCLKSLSELKDLLDHDLITKDEFIRLKDEIMNTTNPVPTPDKEEELRLK